MHQPHTPAPNGVQGLPEPVRYETGKGCLSFVLIGAVLAAIVATVIVLFGDAPSV
jgi:hypothetical protein